MYQSYIYIHTYIFVFCLFRAVLIAYGGSQAGGLIRAATASLECQGYVRKPAAMVRQIFTEPVQA